MRYRLRHTNAIMKRKSKLFGAIVLGATAAVSGLAGWALGSYTESRIALQSLQIVSQGEKAYLFGRFRTAYEAQPPQIALWEGTNLCSFLGAEGPTPSMDREEFAVRMFLCARLALLFQEIGSKAEAQLYAERARVWFAAIETNSLLSAEQVVANCRQRDHVHRRYGHP